MRRKYLNTTIPILDMIWTSPDTHTEFSERVADEDNDMIYISYEIFQYPNNNICEREEQEPVFIFTKRGCVDPKFAVYFTRSGAYRRVEKEKENFDEDVGNFRKLLRIGKVART